MKDKIFTFHVNLISNHMGLVEVEVNRRRLVWVVTTTSSFYIGNDKMNKLLNHSSSQNYRMIHFNWSPDFLSQL